MKRYLFPSCLLVCLLTGFISQSQQPQVEIVNAQYKSSLRGLSVVNDNVVWVSGSNGTVGRSNNAGRNWNWFVVKGFEKAEFRDIEAFDAQTAIVLAIGEPAFILKTADGGATWKTVYENKEKGMFLDAMDFSSEMDGIIVGDPVKGTAFLASTRDGGESWQQHPDHLPLDSGEAFFAASGTNIRYFRKGSYYMASGGIRSRLLTSGFSRDLPLLQGKETTGANSIAVLDNGNKIAGKRMVVVGGDFNADSSRVGVAAYTRNRGRSWRLSRTMPNGYRSSVEFLSKSDLLSCGLNGVDHSTNGGKDWKSISNQGFNVCRIAKNGTAIFLAGNAGKIAKITWR